MKKKYLCFAAAGLCLALSLTACGGGKDEDPANGTKHTSASDHSQPTEGTSKEESSSEKQTEGNLPDSILGDDYTEKDILNFDSILAIDDTGFELYTYVESDAKNYTSTINKAADALTGTCKVYNMIVPTSTAIIFPDNLKNAINSSDQKESIDKLNAMMDKNVIHIPVYAPLRQHRDEYLYFRTDHHWTVLGAYYSYVEFCKNAGLTPHDFSEYETVDFPGFLGTFYKDSGEEPLMKNHPDTVTACYPLDFDNLTMKITDASGETFNWPVITDVSEYNESSKYGTFIGGDNPLTVITHDDGASDTSILVVKESYGNAFVPFLTDHYDTVYVIDYRYWQGNLTEFVKQNNISEVLFINNIGMTRSSYLIGKLAQIIP